MNAVGIIPSRYASKRFPGKPLANLGGKSIIQRVYEQAQKALSTVYVATDDIRIEKEVKRFNGKVIQTSADHQSGTDRIAEAIRRIEDKEQMEWEIVINIQGDEPFIQISQIEEILNCFYQPDTAIATLVKAIEKNEDVFNPNIPKVIVNKDMQAIYFSRSPIPYLRNAEKNEWHKKHLYFKHIGMYAYRKHVLQEITHLPSSALELAESLEQNRWIENNYKIRVNETDTESIGIDTPEDLERAKKYLKK